MGNIRNTFDTATGAAIIAKQTTYLVVPFAEKDQLKAAAGRLPNGAHSVGFDAEKKLWFAKPGANLTQLAQWLPKTDGIQIDSETDPAIDFTDTLKAHGFLIDGLAVMDGRWQRVRTVEDKRGERSGRYRGFLDGIPAGSYQDYRNDIEPHKWRSNGAKVDPAARAHLVAQAEQRNLARQAEQKRRHDHHAQRCSIYHAMLPKAPNDHAYLARKGIPADDDVRVDRKGRLVVPFSNEHGEIRSFQRIHGDGLKRTKKFAEKQGNFFVVGGVLVNGEPILYAEGYATAKSVNLATGLPVVMTIDAGNMAVVAAKLAAIYPKSPHVVLGDDDRKRKDNTGLAAAERAAVLVNGVFAVPSFNTEGLLSGHSDFNDLHASQGLDAVRAQVNAAIESAAPERDKTHAPDQATQQNKHNL